MPDLSTLNYSQKQAVLQTEGPVMILAGAGSGKTRTLVTKIVHLIEEIQVSPFQVLAVTFSNKAAKEMRDRVSTQIETDIGALQITTFHAFCSRILRSEATYLGLSRNFTIYDGGESKAIVKGMLSRRGISQKDLSPFEILYYIEEIKNNGHYPGKKDNSDFEVSRDDEFFSYYEEYEHELHKANAVDFGGLIAGVLQLFETFPEILERYQKRFEYILVDEYQDTNRAQFNLITLLSERKKNICVVGDEDQSIYSWRGADIRNILDFEKVFPDAKIIKLEQNYRSSKIIIEAAGHVISKNEMRKGKKMWTENHEGDSISIIEAPCDKTEGIFVTDEIKDLMLQGGSYDDMAIFYRTNAQSRIIEDYLRTSKIPYRVVGGIKFYERKEIKDLMGYLRLVINQKDSLALSRIINVPARGIGVTSLRKIEQEAITQNISLWEVIVDLVGNFEKYKHIRLSAKVKAALGHFVELLEELQAMSKENELPSAIYDKALYESGYFHYLQSKKDYESMARIEHLEELGNAIIQFEEANPKGGITEYLETITLDSSSDNDENGSSNGEVSLMTVHGAKGLEFPYVFLTGAEENIFPSYKSMESGDNAIEEERRLFYVAMTRAMKKLYVVFAQGRMLFGQIRFNGPSRFIHEIPNHYYEWKKIGKNSYENQSSSYKSDDDYSQESYREYEEESITVQPKSSATYEKGCKLLHGLYGEGIVLESEGRGSDEKVLIKFLDGTKKKFMVKFSPLMKT